MTAKEARALMPDVKNIDEVFKQIKVQAEYGENFTYAKVNDLTKFRLTKLGYILYYMENVNEYKITW